MALPIIGEIDQHTPVWINETGCAPGADKAHWIEDLFTYLETAQVTGLVRFEVDSRDGPDWTLSSTPETVAAARSNLNRWTKAGTR
ncbi:hypothetical protein [Rhodococcus sp. BH5]|uniref:hypothetical protein n=1 Tax=Rhodococcus sp. BH5 TaxID=2871702 RepID=UPI0022CD9B89|nr:hypothetical protein [Rhodococcus sp. BH5]MCZ9635134.1 hypothetical protein [Rhodococcus sp. BH5]